MAVGEKVLRRPGEPIDIFAATPRIGVNTPYDFEGDIRRRNAPIQEMGAQANAFANSQAQRRMDAQRAAMQRALQNAGQFAMQGGPPGMSRNPNTSSGKNWASPVGINPWFGFGQQYKKGGTHKGLDFAVKAGTPVKAPWSGEVLDYEFQPGGFGNNLRVRFDNGIFGILGHLMNSQIKPGSRFLLGDLLAKSGNTGKSTGDHLHFETRYDINDPSSAFDPSRLFGW